MFRRKNKAGVTTTTIAILAIVLLIVGVVGGYFAGEMTGYQRGYGEGEETGYGTGYEKGHKEGYDKGYEAGLAAAPTPTPTPPPPPPPITEVVIGALYPFTGPEALVGELARRVIEMAVREINEAGGIKSLGGAKLRIVYGDTAAKPEIGMAEAERLITEEKVVALMGCYHSSVTLPSSEAAERYKIPFVNPESSSPKLTERGFEWFFRIHPHDKIFAKVHLQFLHDLEEKTGVDIKTIALVYENTLFGTTAGDAWKEYNKDPEIGGFEIVADITYPYESPDLTSEVMTLKEANPDVVLMASYDPDAILFQKTFVELDFNPKAILAMDSGHIHQSFIEAAGKYGDYVLSRDPWFPDVKKDVSLTLDAKYYELYGSHLVGDQVEEYTAVYLFKWVLEKCGSTDPTAIRDTLRTIEVPKEWIPQSWEGIKFGPDGQNIYAAGAIAQLFDGVYCTVWPWDVAAREVVFPQPTWDQR